jgi:hypothetical protein
MRYLLQVVGVLLVGVGVEGSMELVPVALQIAIV